MATAEALLGLQEQTLKHGDFCHDTPEQLRYFAAQSRMVGIEPTRDCPREEAPVEPA